MTWHGVLYELIQGAADMAGVIALVLVLRLRPLVWANQGAIKVRRQVAKADRAVTGKAILNLRDRLDGVERTLGLKIERKGGKTDVSASS